MDSDFRPAAADTYLPKRLIYPPFFETSNGALLLLNLLRPPRFKHGSKSGWTQGRRHHPRVRSCGTKLVLRAFQLPALKSKDLFWRGFKGEAGGTGQVYLSCLRHLTKSLFLVRFLLCSVSMLLLLLLPASPLARARLRRTHHRPLVPLFRALPFSYCRAAGGRGQRCSVSTRGGGFLVLPEHRGRYFAAYILEGEHSPAQPPPLLIFCFACALRCVFGISCGCCCCCFAATAGFDKCVCSRLLAARTGRYPDGRGSSGAYRLVSAGCVPAVWRSLLLHNLLAGESVSTRAVALRFSSVDLGAIKVLNTRKIFGVLLLLSRSLFVCFGCPRVQFQIPDS